MHEEGGGNSYIHQQDFEAEAIDSGHSGNAGERDVIDLGDAEQVPREATDASAREFDRHPEKRRGEERETVSGILARKHANEQAE